MPLCCTEGFAPLPQDGRHQSGWNSEFSGSLPSCGCHVPDILITWQEFERFLKNLRKPKHPTDYTLVESQFRNSGKEREMPLQFHVQELALLYMNMFDADPDSWFA